jgi:broad specificity phosphatase PhoE
LKPLISYIRVGGDYHSLNPPNGETFTTLRGRAKQFYRFIFDNYEGHKVLVISHGTFLQQFHGLILGKSWIESLAITVPNLEMAYFSFLDRRLTTFERVKLSMKEQVNW